jgi:hypothetical protein
VLTHHLRSNIKEFAAYWGSGRMLRLLSDHPDFSGLIQEVAVRDCSFFFLGRFPK